MAKKLWQKTAITFLGLVTTISCGRIPQFNSFTPMLNPTMNIVGGFKTFTLKRNVPQTTRILAGTKIDLTRTEILNLEQTYGIKFIKQVPMLKLAVFDSLRRDPSPIIVNMEKMPKFEYVEQEETLVIDDRPGKVVNGERNNADVNVFAASTDPLIAKQWHLQTINAKTAWKVTEGEGITVAVVDTGVDLTHPDLKANLVPGYNAINQAEPIIDDVNHGTHVAGIIAAVKGNGIGGCGVAPRTKIMPIKALGAGSGGAADVSEGIIWATDHKADVINLSLRFRPSWDAYKQSNKTLKKAITYALKHNVVVVCAMGNESVQENATPAYLANKNGYTNLIAVGSTTQKDEQSDFSNFGPWITLCAPGSDVLSTIPTTEGADNYGEMSGTSMATPVISGVAALILSKTQKHDPAAVKAKLEKSVVDLGDKGFDIKFGYGRIDAALTLK